MIPRLVSPFIEKHLGQPFVVVNRPGGAAVPGTVEASKAKPDGYTVLQAWYGIFTLRPHVVAVPYKLDDFEIIIGMAQQYNTIVVRADSPFKNLVDLVNHARRNPGKLRWGGSPAAAWQHLVGAHFNDLAAIETRFVPFDGGRPAVVALMGGHLDYVVSQPLEYAGELAAGTVRVLTALEYERIPFLPDVPTALEYGFRIAHRNQAILVAPSGVPAERLQRIHDAYKAVLEDPAFIERAREMRLDINYLSGEQAKREIIAQNTLHRELVPRLLR